MFGWLEQAIGALVITLVILDVFLTVLYARAGTGIFSHLIASLVWRVFRLVSKPFGRYQGTVMSFCGPVILVLLVVVWDFGLTLGAALVIHPALGAGVASASGATPTDFITALQAGGNSTSIVGTGDFSPQTSAFRLFYLFASLVGMSVVSLTLTYLMQVYTALRTRNSTALNFHLASGETGDAAELVAGLGPQGKFDGGYANLAELAVKLTEAKEGHHFYPVLFYFRFRESHYSVSRFTLVALDSVTLIKSALDDKKYEWLKESASVTQLWRACMLLLTNLTENFLSGETGEKQPDEQTRERWHRRYQAALQRFRQAGIETIADETAGFEIYVSLRVEWDNLIASLAPLMAYEMEEIDPAGSRPESADEREGFRARSHSAG
jgi:hypothetical protein